MAESAGKSTSKLNYTPDERRLFGQLFSQYDPEGTGIVTGEAAVKLFQRTRLSEQILGEIWGLADTENRGFLQQEDFAKALRLIGIYQAQPGRPLDPELAMSPSPLPKFDGINMAPPAAPVVPQYQPPVAIPAQNSGPIRVPPLLPERVAEYGRLFERAGAQNGLLAGDIVKSSWEKSGLPDAVLSHVWNLSDTEQRGALSTTEFIIAMHLLASYKAKTLTALPQNIPAGLYEAASRRPSLVSARNPGASGSVPRQLSGSSAARPGVRQFTPPVSAAADEWVVGPREKTSYDSLFDKVDTRKLGFITGDQAVVFFSESGLPSETLASIWDLANIRRQDQLNRDEFAVAMHLIRNRTQKGKPPSELPTELPLNFIPPSLRGSLPSAPPPVAEAPLPPAPAPPRSNTDDLFGLDAFSSSPTQVKQQTTGGSGPVNRAADSGPFGDTSPRSFPNTQSPPDNAFFKPFSATSNWGQHVVAQSTGASATSSSAAPKQPSYMDDLLGDNDPEQNKKITKDTADIGNIQNDLNTLRSQMQNLQTKKASSENELAGSSGQKRELEGRLQQFRAQYEQEAKALKALEDQLSAEKAQINQLSQKVHLTQASVQDVQSKHRDVQTQLDSTRRETDGLKERLRQMNEYIAQTTPEIERLQSQLRHQKGMTAITRKQSEKLEEEKSQLEKTKNELATELSKAEDAPRPPVTRETTGPSAASPSPSVGSSTNPFMRRSPQQSVDNTMTPSGFSRSISQEGNRFDNLFSQAFSSGPTSAPPPNTSFRQDAYSAPSQSGPSIRSSEGPDFPTPSTSPPLSAYQESPQLAQVPPPPASRQITSKDLPLTDQSESAATSVQVESPLSRYDNVPTPTNPLTSSPRPQTGERTETSRSVLSGSSLFDKPSGNSSPVASLRSEATKKAGETDFFSNLGSSREVASPGQDNKSPGPHSDPFGFAPIAKSSTGSKGDIEAAFASVGKGPSRQGTAGQSNGGDPLAKFNNDFPPIGTREKKKEEFPPIKDLPVEESDSEDDAAGFDDDFTKASPAPNKPTQESNRPQVPSGGNELDNFFSKPSPGNVFDFGGPIASAPRSAEVPKAPSSGEALFGSKSSTTAAGGPSSTSMFSTSPPTSNPSDGFESAVSHQSSTKSRLETPTTTAPKFSNFDDFSGFDDLTDAKEVDERADDDLLFSHHDDDHQFSPAFDSPSASHLGKSQASPSSASASKNFAFPSFQDGAFDNQFDSSFPRPPPPTAPVPPNQSTPLAGAPAPLPKAPSTNDWDTMMKGIDDDADHAIATDDEDIMPEAPEPPSGPRPNLGRTETTDHDDPYLKQVTALGYPRPLALKALEKFDYDIDSAVKYLGAPK